MMKFLICTVLPPGASKVDQTPKFYDFYNLIQVFPKTRHSVLVEIKVVRNSILNNFEYHNQPLKMHRFLTRSL